MLHVALLAASLLCLPILASSGWKPQGDEQPMVRILLLLGATIGLPYFCSTTTPLLQAWYWRRFRTVVPYRLFALSNLASLLALLGFPVLFEPAFDLKALGWGWSFLFAGFALLCAATAWLSMNGFEREARAPPRSAPPENPAQWLALAAMGSVMLLAVSNHITQNIASVPFLWVLPLALYLVTFIRLRPSALVHPAVFIGALVVLVPLMAYTIPSLDLQGRAAYLGRALRRVHGVPRRARAAEAGPGHLTLLPHDLARRRARRGAGGNRRAARPRGLLRARHRAVALASIIVLVSGSVGSVSR